MTVNRIIEDKELGPLFVRVNARARRLTFRTKGGRNLRDCASPDFPLPR